jgi:hypothetical protein
MNQQPATTGWALLPSDATAFGPKAAWRAYALHRRLAHA